MLLFVNPFNAATPSCNLTGDCGFDVVLRVTVSRRRIPYAALGRPSRNPVVKWQLKTWEP